MDVFGDCNASSMNKQNEETSISKGIDNENSMVVEAVNESNVELSGNSGNVIKIIQINDQSDYTGNCHLDLDTSRTTNTTEFVIVSSTSIDCDNRLSSNNHAVIKEEPDAIATGEVFENDPMDLLVLNGRSDISSSKSNGEEGDNEEPFDDLSSTGSTSTLGTSFSNSILELCREYQWLLYEESDELFGYCLHCDVRLSVRSPSYVKQHSMSLYHKERSANYLAFREQEERSHNGTPLVGIKEEFGTESYVAALKLKRKSQAEALNNYNWQRWLKEYPWLERESNTGTLGLCKYCDVRINVEFEYLRTRHQETAKHKEFEKEYNSSQQKNTTLNARENAPSNKKSPKENTSLCEPANQQFAVLRCKICDITVAKNNFKRHLRTNLHIRRESEYVKSQKANKTKKTKLSSTANESDEVSAKSSNMWVVYAKKHPWLIADPTDETHAYCKYCEKRVIYGNSAAKRAAHENSAYHRNRERDTNVNINDCRDENENSDEEQNNDGASDEESNTGGDDEDGDDTQDENDEASEESEGEESDGNDDNDQNNENSEQEEEEEEEENESDEDENEEKKNSDDQNDSKKRIYRHDSEWYNQYPWCKKYKPDPANYCFCSYCKIVISKRCNRMKHSQTGRHVAAEAEYLRRQNKKKKLYRSKNNDEEYDWAVDIKSQPNLYYCKYCRVRISRRYSKKQHAISKIHQINQNLFKSNRNPVKQETNGVVQTTTLRRHDVASLTKVEKVPSFITLVKQWQKKFTWLSYKRSEMRSNYAFCKVCEQSVFVRTIKSVIKHQRSGKHIRTANQIRRQKLQQQREEQNETNKTQTQVGKRELESTKTNRSEATNTENATVTTTETKKSLKESVDKSLFDDMQERFSWIEKSMKPNYVHCRFCDEQVYLKALFLKNHSNSKSHRQSVIKYRQNDTKREKRRHSESNTNASDVDDGGGDDVVVIEDNTEEILISEQDDNWTVKSENMDEHEALDFLLQRSGNSSQQLGGHTRPSKRAKKSSLLNKINENNTSLVASILSAPLTLASCLGPLIQQQIQQATSTQLQQSSTTTTTVCSQSENSFDLFFKSVSETMKKLPTDLAADGKVKIMQIICDLELKALKRQQPSTTESEIASTENSSNLANDTPITITTSPNKQPGATEINTNKVVGNNNRDAPQQVDQTINETIITTMPDETPVNIPVQSAKSSAAAPAAQYTEPKNKDTNANISQSPIVGVIDKNGLNTVHFNNAIVKQIPKSSISPTNTLVSNSAIRCIPFKNLSHSIGTDGNARFTRIQMPVTPNPTTSHHAVSQSSHHNIQSAPNINASERPKGGMVNVRSIQLGKRTTLVPQSIATSTTNNVLSAKKPQCSYTVATTNVQRWTAPMHGPATGANISRQISSNNLMVQNQKTPPTSRNYNH
ncbi:suppressor of variegation 3-7 isoform X2 [Musca autumnalis]|uniref:suppressor of variegation 3-7 isoform X2 n=1 Tax=Musca autumnalis TaxID=221902 RepID=UPI003CFA2F66